MKKTNKSKLFQFTLTALATAALITACGGGGGGGGISTNPPAVAPVTPVIASQLQLTVAAPPYTAGSEELKSFNYLNDLRKSLGLGLLAYSAELDKASANHGKYLVLNNTFTHTEDAGKPGYSGLNPIDQARYAGYTTQSNFVNAVTSPGITKTDALQRNVDTIYHRSVVLGQEWTDVGSASFCYVGFCDGFTTINVFLGHKGTTGQTNAADFVFTYPKDKQLDVNISFGNENPNPFPIEHPSGDFAGKVGYPVSFVLADSQTLDLKSFTITEAGQSAPLTAWLYTKDNDPNKFVARNEAYLTSKSSLKPATTYNVKVEASASGKDVSRTWSFTTATVKP